MHSKVFLPLLILFCLTTLLCACGNNKYHHEDRSWVHAANLRIKKYRKADVHIIVVDKNNIPVKNAIVQIIQLKQAFKFGSLVRGHRLISKDTIYQNIVKTHFNLVVPTDFQWIHWNNPKRKEPNRHIAQEALTWCKQQRLTIKGHYLAWAPVRNYDIINTALSYKQYSNPALYRQALMAYIKNVLENTKGTVTEWDAINHLVAKNQKKQLTDKYYQKLSINDYLGEDIFKEIFDTAKKINPAISLGVNEDHLFTDESMRSNYYNKIASLQKRHIPIGTVGIMSHFDGDALISMNHIQSVLNQYSKLGIPIKITEFDVAFGKRNEDYHFTDDELQLQAHYTEDYMRLCFSNPAVNGFIIWGIWEGDHWNPSAALYNRNWSIKPNGKVWEKLVMHEWMTNETRQTTSNGQLLVNGFLGDYKLIVKLSGGSLKTLTFKLGKAGQTLRVKI